MLTLSLEARRKLRGGGVLMVELFKRESSPNKAKARTGRILIEMFKCV